MVDAIHQPRLIELIKKYGYPTRRLIGKEGMEKSWLLVQHQDSDIELQRECLKKCDFKLSEKAHLTDRVLVNSGKQQRYGTQFCIDEKKGHMPRPIEDRAHVDEQCKKAGLPTIKAYTEQMRWVYRKEH